MIDILITERDKEHEEVVAIIEDGRIDRIGSGNFAKNVWELVMFPALGNNSEVRDVTDKDIQKELESFQST